MPAGNAYLSGHLDLSPFWELAYALIVETSLPELVVSFLDFSPWISINPWYFLDFALSILFLFVHILDEYYLSYMRS